jgi:hypothetical protein
MDLLACSKCEHRFYVNGMNSPEGLWCSHCGGDLELALHHISSIPLDARWLNPHSAMEAPESTIVDLRRKRARAGRTTKRIVKDLAHYFDVRSHGRSLEVWVNRGASENAALRVAAVLDGVDSGWEQHFYLPTVDREDSAAQIEPPQQRGANHLRLVSWRNERETGSA